MSKKIKIIISIILFALCFILIQNSYAQNLGLSSGTHYDSYLGMQELLPQLVSENQNSAKGAIMCIQKGGALRFTKDYSGAINDANMSLKPYSLHYSNHKCGLGDGWVEAKSVDAARAGILNGFGENVHKILEGMIPEYALPKGITYGTWSNYGKNGDFVFNSNVVMQNKVGTTEEFAKTPNYNLVKTTTENNNYISYLLSSGSWSLSTSNNIPSANGHSLKPGNYQQTLSDSANAQLIQDAIWCSPLNSGKAMSTPQQAINLLNEANAYATMINQLTNYQASFLNTNPKVIVNQSEGTYVIGPYAISYPNDRRFSYIQDIYVINSNGNKVNTQVIVANSNNGGYPVAGENFFLKFKASDIGNSPYVNVKAEFAYLKSTSATYSIYEGKGDICVYVGYYTEESSSHQNTYQDGYEMDEKTGKLKLDPSSHQPIPKIAKETCYIIKFIPHISGEQKVGSYNAQRLIRVVSETTTQESAKEGTISRIWAEHSITTPNSLGLRMSLGGYVWEDVNSGKESIANGIMDATEQKIPNVIVNLYKQNGGLVESKKTDQNGQYRFDNLNAMDRYYVTFTYNGQYYEPTNYTSPSDSTNGWGRGNWQTNSNATDKKTEREAYNKKFENIGSAPANYVVSGQNRETYTKNELLGLTLDANGQYKQTKQAVIDKFGNLIVQNSDATTNKMIQYVKDCYMTASTGNGTGAYDVYPYPSTFTIDNAPVATTIPNVPSYAGLYPSAYYINLGLHPRQEADLAIKKDIEKVVLEINGQTQEYTYDTLENKADADKTWDISVRLSDAYYNTNYSREIYASDYLYKVSNYGADFAKYGKDKSSELEVYVTYKIMVRNQSLSIRMKVNEIVDYYDQDYEYVDSRSYIQFARNGERKSVNTRNNSIYGATTETTLKDYNKIYIEGLNGEYLSAGQTAYIYLTFKVKKDINGNEAWLKLDENVQNQAAIGVGKENIVEINGYSSQYAPGTKVPNVGDVGGTPAGLIDTDSKPGNINPSDVPKDGTIKYQNLEDDTDKAPNLRLKLYRDDSANRVISGVVWEDERTQTIEATTTGDGIKQDNEKRINGVTVQLVEIMANGTEFVWKTFEEGSGMVASTAPVINSNGIVANYDFPANHAGAYAFKSFIPGKYIVRFIYGDSEKTVLTNTDNNVNQTLGKKGQNEKSYNGQDYKSTIYQSGITQNGTYAWRNNSTWNLGQEVVGGVIKEISSFKAEALQNDKGSYLDATSQNNTGSFLYDTTESDKKPNVSDAKDMASERNKVVDYSKGEMTNEKAEVLASFRDLPTYEGKGYTKEEMQKLINELIEKTKMRAETGVIVMEIEYNKKQTGEQVVNNKTSYTVSNVDLGLEERPKAQIAIDKKVTHVKLTLADGTILFDTQGPTTNVLWKEHKPYSNNETLMNPATFGTLANIRKLNTSRVGLIQLSMDEELMHGATIQISYSIRAGNIGEVDYLDNLFYYTGQVKDKTKVVKAKATQVVDYVANNLQFNATDNDNLDWTLTNKDELISQGLINKKLESAVEKYNTILITDKLNEYLVPTVYKEKVDRNAKDTTDSISLVLTQVITPENDTDDLSYRNIVEIVKASNTIGRRNEFSVVGNQDPTLEPQEIDTDRAEVVKILPPFGNAGIYIVIALIVIATSGIVVGGIIFIKKKVLNK